jgi:hypothetical protein
MTAVLNSTSIRVNWSIATADFENVTRITVFYKKTVGTIQFNSIPVPASSQGGVVLENLEKYTWYKITLSPTTVNGTGIPSRIVKMRTKEDGECSRDTNLRFLYVFVFRVKLMQLNEPVAT